MHSGTIKGIRACRLVTCPRKGRFGKQGFVFQFCDDQNLGQSFEQSQIDTRKPKNSHFVEKSHYYGGPIRRLPDWPSERLIDRRESSETEGLASTILGIAGGNNVCCALWQTGRCAFTDAFLYFSFCPFFQRNQHCYAVIKEQFVTWLISTWSGWYGQKPLATVSTLHMLYEYSWFFHFNMH
jgi:hypothetical protein